MKLNDKEIRTAFIKALRSRKPAPNSIIEELSVDSGNAIADIVTVYKELHCYEIKGESDKIERLRRQSISFDLAFRKLTLITTSNQLAKAKAVIPTHWGLIESKFVANQVKFIYQRKALTNPKYCKYTALQTLWKEEMMRIAAKKTSEPLKKSCTRDFISTRLASQSGKLELSELIAEQLQLR